MVVLVVVWVVDVVDVVVVVVGGWVAVSVLDVVVWPTVDVVEENGGKIIVLDVVATVV